MSPSTPTVPGMQQNVLGGIIENDNSN
jgi:hypothetical protein